MSELDPLDKRLDMAWRALSPPEELAARVRARLDAAGGAAAATTLAENLASRWRALRASGLLGGGAGALLLGIGVALGYLIPRAPVDAARAPDGPAPAASARAPALRVAPVSTSGVASGPATSASIDAATDAGAASSAPLAPAAATSPRRALSAAAARARNSRRSPVATADPSAELLLLERAERAVRAHNPALALALIAELEHGFPRSPLHEERRSIELMAHCQARGGSVDTSADTQGRIERFRRRYPESVYTARIAEECNTATSVAPLTNSTAADIHEAEGENDAHAESP